MSVENVCWLCLATDIPMRDLNKSPLLDVYEKLTNITTDDRPVTICNFCLSQLKKCHALMLRAVTVYRLLSQIQQNGMMVNRESIAMIDREAYKLDYRLSITQAEYIVVGWEHYLKTAEIKDEQLLHQDVALKTEILPNVEDVKREVIDEVEGKRVTNDKDMETEKSKKTNGLSDESTCRSNINQNNLKCEVSEDVEEVVSERLNRRSNYFEIDTKRESENIVENVESTDERDIGSGLWDYTAYNEYDAFSDIEDMKLQHIDGDAPAQQDKQIRNETQDKMLTTGYENNLNIPRCKADTEAKEYSEKAIFSEHKSKHSDSEVRKSYLDRNIDDTALNYDNDKTYLQTKFVCDNCNTEFDDICLLMKHMKLHKIVKVNITNDKLRPHECNFCEKTFIKKGFFMRHLKMHAEKKKMETSEYNNARVLRDKTNETINRREFENKYVENKYLKTKFVCDHCGTEFDDKCLLIKHMEFHNIVKINVTNDKLRPHECNLCEKTFIKRGFLVRHLKMHAEKKKMETSEYNSARVLPDKTNKPINRQEFVNAPSHSDIENKKYFDLKSNDENNIDKNINVETKFLQTKFICDYCDAEFGDKCLLIKHMKFHKIVNVTSDKERPYGCTVFKKKNIKKGIMLRHLKTHTNEHIKTQKRGGGKRKSKTSVQLTVHCPVCQKICFKHHLKIHLRTHTGEKPYECSTCLRKFRQMCHLKRHERIHTGEKPYECSICFRKFTQKYDMKLHLIRHTDTVSHADKFECPTCDRKFSKKKYLNFHMKRHDLGCLFECNICKRRYTKESYLNIHITTHTGEKPFECNICHAKFNRKTSLYTHVKNHSGEKPFECDICHRKYNMKKVLIRHLRIHSGETPYECNICYRRFNRKFSLSNHLKRLHSNHTGEEPFECTICHEKFNKKESLYTHVNNHSAHVKSEKKRFVCDHCQRQLSSKVSLIRHLKLLHSGETPYECDICNRKFNLKYSLSNHIKTEHVMRTSDYP